MVATQEQAMGSAKAHHHQLPQAPQLLSIKGKRTKRPRHPSPASALVTASNTALTMSCVSPSASGSASTYSGAADEAAVFCAAGTAIAANTATSSTTITTSADYPQSTTTTEEEQDMANCLILLAQGNTSSSKRIKTNNLASNSSQILTASHQQQQPIASVGVTIPKITEATEHTSSMMGPIIPPTTTIAATSSAAAVVSAPAPAASPGGGGVNNYAYECKTCNRSFPSFQALGGHRASHTKPKQTPPPPSNEVSDKKHLILSPFSSDDGQLINDDSSSLSLQIATTQSYYNNHTTTNTVRAAATTPQYNKSAKVHECTICGAEFSSGQALGGHMRRHRTLLSGGGNGAASITAASPVSSVMPLMNNIGGCISRMNENIITEEELDDEKARTRNLLSLDLNLPAPAEDDHHRGDKKQPSKFMFSSNGKTLIFTASSLVDCHY